MFLAKMGSQFGSKRENCQEGKLAIRENWGKLGFDQNNELIINKMTPISWQNKGLEVRFLGLKQLSKQKLCYKIYQEMIEIRG